MTDPWSLIILNPVLNVLIALSHVLFSNFGLAIIALTIIVRLALLPLTLRQLNSTKALQAMQPKIQELQKKYGKNKEKLQQEMMKLYKEAGVNPMGCLWPMLVQFPVWIALYQSIMRALATTPESLLDLSQHLYSWQVVTASIPLSSHFLWLDLAYPDSTLILAIIVGGSMWVQQKMVTAPTPDPRQQSMNRMMQMMMPLMFALFTLMFPSGLALFWAVSNIIGIGIQYLVTGWGYLRPRPSAELAPAAGSKSATKKAPQSGQKPKGLLKRRG
jgi:YidC/Oxa1 family membrane protein insertase